MFWDHNLPSFHHVFCVQFHFGNRNGVLAGWAAVKLFAIKNDNLFLLSLFSALPLLLLFFFLYKSLYSLPSWGSIRVSVQLLFSLKLNTGLCVIQEEAAKPKTFSFQRLSPKWCFLDCEYSVISTTLGLLPEHLQHFEHLQAFSIFIIPTQVQPQASMVKASVVNIVWLFWKQNRYNIIYKKNEYKIW